MSKPVILGQFEGSLIKEEGGNYALSTIGNPRWDYEENRNYCNGWYFWHEVPGGVFLCPTSTQIKKLCADSNFLLLSPGYNTPPENGRVMLQAASQCPGKICLLLTVEEENHHYADTGQSLSREEEMNEYWSCLMKRLQWLARLHGQENEVTADYLQQLKAKYGYRYCAWPNMLWSIHRYYQAGFDLLMREVGAWYPNTLVSFAFQRGAAKQYRKQWGMFFSPWGNPRDAKGIGCGPTSYDEQGRHLTGLSADLIQLHNITAWLSGADVIMTQETIYTHWINIDPIKYAPNCADQFRVIWKQEPSNQPALSPVGENAVKFADFALRRYPHRGDPITPFAILLDANHGYDPGQKTLYSRSIWCNHLPYEYSDCMVDSLLGWLYPGFEMSGHSFEHQWNPAVNWESEKQYCEWMDKGFDQRPFEKGYLCPTRYGDTFDVLVDKGLDLSVLQRYEAIFIVGSIIVDEALLRLLNEYCRRGGSVIVTGRHLMSDKFNALKSKEFRFGRGKNLPRQEDIEAFIGSTYVKLFDRALEPSRCLSCGMKIQDPKYQYLKMKPITAAIIMENESGDPLITSNSIGQGKVYLIAADYGQCSANSDFLPSTKHFLDEYLHSLLPIQIVGLPIQYHLINGKHGVVVGLVNNGESSWKGEIRLKTGHASVVIDDGEISARDIWEDKGYPMLKGVDGKRALEIEVSPFSFKLIEFEHYRI